MIDLPVGWLNTTIGDLCGEVARVTPQKHLDKPFQYIDIGSIDSTKLQIVDAKQVSPKAASPRARQVVREGDTLLSTTRVYLKNIAIVPAELDGQIASTAFCVLRPNSKVLDRKYLHYYVQNQTFINELTKLQRGNSPPAVLDEDVNSQSFPLAPLNEQRRIVSKIEELFSDLDEGEAALQRVQKLLVSYRQSVLKAAVTGELTKEWREANQHRLESGEELLQRILKARRVLWQGRGHYEEPQPPRASRPANLPVDWLWVSMEQLLRATLMNGRSVPDAERGFPVLRLTALKNGRLDLSERKIGAWTEGEARPYLVALGDFFVSRGNGSLSLVGRGGLVTYESESVAFPDTLIRIRTNKDACHQSYLALIWNSYFMRSQIEASARTTAGIYKINQQDICSFVLPLPSLEEQIEIANRIEDVFSRIDALDVWCTTELNRSATLRQSILKAAFSGKLAPQDPTDEPAEALLERIKSGGNSSVSGKLASRKVGSLKPKPQLSLWEST